MSRKIPRGRGYDKAATLAHLKKMVKGGINVTDYVKQEGLHLDSFMLAVNKHDEWAGIENKYISHDPKLIEKRCEECMEAFWPVRASIARFCSTTCRARHARDQEYFGGRRNETKGLAESVCQLCQRHVDKGLSSHHIYGKSNDTENEFLLALCSGCHSVVSELALKKWIGDTEIVGKLVWLANTQRNGAEALALRQKSNLGIRVEVCFHKASYEQS